MFIQLNLNRPTTEFSPWKLLHIPTRPSSSLSRSMTLQTNTDSATARDRAELLAPLPLMATLPTPVDEPSVERRARRRS